MPRSATSGALLATDVGRDRIVKEYPPPSPLPTYLEGKKTAAFPDARARPAPPRAAAGRAASGIDELLGQADSILDGDQARVREQKVERSVGIHRRRLQDLRDYQRGKEQPQVPEWMAEAQKHKGPAPLKSLDDWLGQAGGPRLRGRNPRELEKHPTAESYYPRQMESASQYDSEMRANQMVRNGKKLRAVEQTLNEIYNKSRPAGASGTAKTSKTSKSFPVDEVMAKVTPKALELVHEKFKAMGGEMNVVEFIEVMAAHLPRHDWEDDQCMANDLLEVYNRLDLDGDGVVSWDEMFEFTVEMGRAMSNKGAESLNDVILDYKPADVSDKRGEMPADRTGGVKDGEIERIESLALMDRLAVLEKDSAVIKLYDADTLDLTDCLVGHKGPVMRCLHLEGTDYVVSSGTDTCLIFWGAYTNSLRQILPCNQVFMSLVWDAAQNILYAGSTNGYVHCFRIPAQDSATTTNQIEEIDRFSAHKDVVTDMLAIRDLGLLITASMDSSICVWDLAGHELKRKLQGHAQGVYTLGYISSQRYLISAGFDQNFKVWNPMIEEPLFTLTAHNNSLAGLKAIVGSNRVVTADIDGEVKVWDIRNFMCCQIIPTEKAESGSVTSVAYVARLDRLVLSCVFTRRVHRMYCLDYEHALAPEVADEGPLVTAIVSISNNSITTASMRTVRVWDALTGILRKTFQDIAPANITAMCFDNREQRIVVGDEDGQIGVYNCLNGALLKKLDPHWDGDMHYDVCALAYCPYSKCILSASWGGRVRIHHDNKPDTSKILRQIDAHITAITCIAYSVKLGIIATASSAGGVRLWDFDDIKLAGVLQAHTTEVTLLHWIDDYRALLTGDFLGNIILWTVAPWREKYKPICRWEFVVKIDSSPPSRSGSSKPRAQSAVSIATVSSGKRGSRAAPSPIAPTEAWSDEAMRDTPTCCAFDVQSHTVFIGGTSGEIVAYDLKAVKGALIEWMGVDVSSKKHGTHVPPIAPRVFVKNPREGRNGILEAPKAEDNFADIDSVIKSSGDINFDIGKNLDWSKDIHGILQTPRLEQNAVRRKYAWVAHQDSIKSFQLVESASGDGGAQGAPSTFMTEAPDCKNAGSKPGDSVSALLSASTDQRVCLWDLQGNALGQLRQGDRDKAQRWEFPFTAEMMASARADSLDKIARQLQKE